MLLRIFRLAHQLHVVLTTLDPGIVKTEVVNTGWTRDSASAMWSKSKQASASNYPVPLALSRCTDVDVESQD
jgi:hypothetical protein